MSEIKNKINRCRTLGGLDGLGLSLANRKHQWSGEERAAFDRKVRELKRGRVKVGEER